MYVNLLNFHLLGVHVHYMYTCTYMNRFVTFEPTCVVEIVLSKQIVTIKYCVFVTINFQDSVMVDTYKHLCFETYFCRKDRMVQSLQSELRSAPKQDYVDK